MRLVVPALFHDESCPQVHVIRCTGLQCVTNRDCANTTRRGALLESLPVFSYANASEGSVVRKYKCAEHGLSDLCVNK